MSDKIRKAAAFLIVAVLIFCFASCKNDDHGDGMTTDTADVYKLPDLTGDDTTQQEATTKKNTKADDDTATVVLTTVPGGQIPTVVTSQWNTTLPAEVTQPPTTQLTTLYLTVPSDYTVTVPTMPTVVAVTTTEPSTTGSIPSTDIITQIDPNGQVVTVYSTDASTQPAKPDGTKTTASSTEKPQPQGINLVESGFCAFDSEGSFICGLEGTGWQDSFKVTTVKTDVYVNGEVIKKVTVTAQPVLNEDGEIDVYLKTSSSQIHSGDNVTFVLPEGFLKSNDDMLYSNEKTVSVFAS